MEIDWKKDYFCSLKSICWQLCGTVLLFSLFYLISRIWIRGITLKLWNIFFTVSKASANPHFSPPNVLHVYHLISKWPLRYSNISEADVKLSKVTTRVNSSHTGIHNQNWIKLDQKVFSFFPPELSRVAEADWLWLTLFNEIIKNLLRFWCPTLWLSPCPSAQSESNSQMMVTRVQKAVYSNLYSQGVTNRSQPCLTSVIGRELVCSMWYGRWHLKVTITLFLNLSLIRI